MTGAVSERKFERHRDGLRWGTCFAVILALHAGGFWISSHVHPAAQPALATPPAILIDLPPVPAARPAPPHEIAHAVNHEVPKPPQPLIAAAPARVSRVDVPLPPKATAPSLERAATAALPKTVVDAKAPEPVTTAVANAEAPAPATSAAAAPAATAPAAAPAPSTNAVPTWQGLLLGRLQRFKRYPAIAQARHQQGVVYLRFSMDRHGNVASAAIDKSSGFDALDAEALALIHRAEPLPIPPAEVPGDPIELVVPIQFFLKTGF